MTNIRNLPHDYRNLQAAWIIGKRLYKELPASNSCGKNRLAESDPCQDLRENLIITKKYVLKMSVPTEIGAQMLSFL